MQSPSTIDEYIDLADPNAQALLHEVRNIIRASVPEADECLRYKMPAFKLKKTFIYFAAFKKHIGVYPPVSNDESLILELSKYRNEKGNLRFPLNEPMPYTLIGQVAKALAKQYAK